MSASFNQPILVNQAPENQKKQRRHHDDALQKRQKRQHIAQAAPELQVPVICLPAKHLFFDAPVGTASSMIINYLRNLQLKDIIARPANWPVILNNPLARKNYDTSIPQNPKQYWLDHSWNQAGLIHYYPIYTENELQAQLDSGLPLPVVILPNTPLSQDSFSSTWAQKSFNDLLDHILQDDLASIEEQDYGLANPGSFTMTKTCADVRARFDIRPEHRGLPWNCLEIGDNSPGFKGPRVLEDGGSLRKWQLNNSGGFTANRSFYAPLPGSKSLGQWLLISEKNSASTAHVDIAVTTWVTCLAGKKTFWIRNPSGIDQTVWEYQDVDIDHRFYSEPWARIDLYPGTTL